MVPSPQSGRLSFARESRFGGYRIEAAVGRGGMATVYRAEHVHLRRQVALKVPMPELAEDAAFRERFIRESRAAATLTHPNLVAVYDAGEIDGVLFLAMQFVEGDDLGAVAQARRPAGPGARGVVIDADRGGARRRARARARPP